MIIALWMMWVANNTSGAAHVGDFETMDACKKAATGQQHVGSKERAPYYSFVCVQSK
jgi:hypothetical protein